MASREKPPLAPPSPEAELVTPAPSRFEQEVREKGYLDEADVTEDAILRGIRRARRLLSGETRPAPTTQDAVPVEERSRPQT